MKLAGAAAIVTGAATGIGSAIALRLADAGCHVAVDYSRSETEARATAAEVEARGVEALCVRADVASDADCRRLVAETVARWHRLDVLVNNAATTAVVAHANLDGLSDEMWEQIFAVNVRGAFAMARAAAAPLAASGQGAIVNISSIGGPGASSIAYAASKAALDDLTRSLARALAPVRVNAVAPGFVDTRWSAARFGDRLDAARQLVRQRTPLGRVAAPDDVAQAALGLLGMDFVTGQILAVDGGITLGGAMIVDAWVNVRFAGQPWQRQAAERFGLADDALRPYTPAELLAVMDPLGIDRAIIGVNGDNPEKDVLAFAAEHPERFALAAYLDPRRGMKAVRALAALARDHRIAAVRLIPSLWNLPPDDRMYYPIYAQCVELGIAVCVTTGLPVPPLPGRCQDPIALDDVCLFFPELRVVMANGADPWWPVATRLMARHPNLWLMTSAWAPSRLPAELVGVMRGGGGHKVIFGTDFPFLTAGRCLAEARGLGLPGPALMAYLGGNAAQVFFP